MKRFIVLACTSAILLTACSANKANQNGPVAVKSELKGTWNLVAVNYDPSFSVKPFGEGLDIKCFQGSTWNLVPNNGKGSYQLTDPNCPSITRNIIFNLTKDGTFSFKVLSPGEKAKNVTAGYFLHFENQTPTSFDLMQNVSDGSTPTQSTYHFQKVN